MVNVMSFKLEDREEEALRNKYSVQLDELDIKIIRYLQKNGRASFNEIARALGVSVATISNRIKALEEKEVIRGYSACIDCEKVGYHTHLFVLIKISSTANVEEVGKRIGKIERVKCIYRISGRYDLLVYAYCINFTDATKILDEIQSIEEVTDIEKIIGLKRLKEDFCIHT